MLSEYLMIGKVLRPQGIKGLVKVKPETDDPARVLDLEFVFVKKGEQEVEVTFDNGLKGDLHQTYFGLLLRIKIRRLFDRLPSFFQTFSRMFFMHILLGSVLFSICLKRKAGTSVSIRINRIMIRA